MPDSEKLIMIIQEIEDELMQYRQLMKKSELFSNLLKNHNDSPHTCLDKTESKNVDMIYIASHVPTKEWVMEMQKKIEMAHSLLKDTGIMFLHTSIDLHGELKILCDTIFGHENYLTSFVVKKNSNISLTNQKGDFIHPMDMILFYRKSLKYKIPTQEIQTRPISEYVYEIVEKDKKKKLTLDNKEVFLFCPGNFLIKKGTPSINKYRKVSIRSSIKTGKTGSFYEQNLKNRNEMNHLYKVYDSPAHFCFYLSPKKKGLKNGFYFEPFEAVHKKIPYSTFLDIEMDNNIDPKKIVDIPQTENIPTALFNFLLGFSAANHYLCIE